MMRFVLDDSVENADWVKTDEFDMPSTSRAFVDSVLGLSPDGLEREDQLRVLGKAPWLSAAPDWLQAEIAEALDDATLVDIIKASFGGDRSAAGRYAAEQRWKNHRKKTDGAKPRTGGGVDITDIRARAAALAERASKERVETMLKGGIRVESGGDAIDRVTPEGMRLAEEIEALGGEVLTLAEAEAEKEVGPKAMAEYRAAREESDRAADKIRRLVTKAENGTLTEEDLWDDELLERLEENSISGYDAYERRALREEALIPLEDLQTAGKMVAAARLAHEVAQRHADEFIAKNPSVEQVSELERTLYKKKQRLLTAKAIPNVKKETVQKAQAEVEQAQAEYDKAREQWESSGTKAAEDRRDSTFYDYAASTSRLMGVLSDTTMFSMLTAVRSGRHDSEGEREEREPQPVVSAVQEVIGRKALEIAKRVAMADGGKEVKLRTRFAQPVGPLALPMPKDSLSVRGATEIVRDVAAELPPTLVEKINGRGTLSVTVQSTMGASSAQYLPDLHGIELSDVAGKMYGIDKGKTTRGDEGLASSWSGRDSWGVKSEQVMRWQGYHEMMHVITYVSPAAALVESAVVQRRALGRPSATIESDGVKMTATGGTYAKDLWHDGYAGRLYEDGARETLSVGMEYLMGVGRSRDEQTVDTDLAAAALGAILVGGS